MFGRAKNNEFSAAPSCTAAADPKNVVISFTYGQIRDPRNNGIWALGTTNLNTAEGGDNNGIGIVGAPTLDSRRVQVCVRLPSWSRLGQLVLNVGLQRSSRPMSPAIPA
jgi:hypothetical protein